MKEFDLRTVKDRRKQPTPGLSRFTLWGQRRAFRRGEDKKRGGYVDRYSPGLLFLLISVVGLNVLDALFTMMILEDGGWEVNPVVRSVIQLYGDRFWIWKFAMASISLILLCLHSRFRLVTPIILGIGSISVIVIFYQVLLYIF